MEPTRSELDERTLQCSLLFSRIGEPGSGYARYSAAMYFFNEGILSAELLEIYRRCCKFDIEDPIELARHEGIPPLSEMDIRGSGNGK